MMPPGPHFSVLWVLRKWHPDKQATAEHVDFATQVMQALQNQPEWAA